MPTQGARRNAATALRSSGCSGAASDTAGDDTANAEPWTDTRPKVAHLNAGGVVIAATDEWQAGASHGELLRSKLGTDFVRACELSASQGSAAAAEAARLTRHALAGGENTRKCVYQRDASWFTLQVIALPPRRGGAVVVVDDITAHQQLELDLRHRAFHDPLTGLPNRALLTDRLEHAVAGATRERLALAVLFIDLDDFKSVNDRLGHLAGDATLAEVASRLAECVRTSDTVGRWGGDEFVVVAERLDISVTADMLAGRISQRLREPIEIAGKQLVVSASIGIALLEDHESGADLVEAADRALIITRRGRGDRGRTRRRSFSEIG